MYCRICRTKRITLRFGKAVNRVYILRHRDGYSSTSGFCRYKKSHRITAELQHPEYKLEKQDVVNMRSLSVHVQSTGARDSR